VLHVNTNTDVMTVQSESGRGVDLLVDANTQFFFRQPHNGPRGRDADWHGTAFLTNHELVRGFKVHCTACVDPLATPLGSRQTVEYRRSPSTTARSPHPT